MRWFTGPIADAIAQARSTKSYFVVYVKGKDGDTKTEEFTSLLNSEEMTRILDSENFVKIQLTLDTPECSQFSQIYPVILVPSIYFIDQQGSPVEVIGGNIRLEQLRGRILKLISKPEEDIESASPSEVLAESLESTPGTSNETSDNQMATQDLNSSLKDADTAYTIKVRLESEEEPQIKKAKESSNAQDVKKETRGSDIAVKTDNESANSSNETAAAHDVAGDVTSERGTSVSDSLSLEERVEKARQLAEVIRLKKEREEKEKEKRLEIERRETLKNIQKFKREQEEKEMRELAEQRKKEKEADRLAREKVKKQIEQDRIDKAARFNMVKHSDVELEKEAEAKKQAEAQARSAAEAAARSSCARIQFRLPDGSVLTNVFLAESRFDEVYSFLRQQQNFPFRDFRLLTTYPRREFGNNDRTCTFQELQLAPSACILVIPSTEVARHGGDGMISSLVQMLTAPLITLFGYVRLFIFGTALPPAPATENQVPRQRDNSTPLNRNDENSNATSSSGVRRRNTDSGSTSRREGNVHRFVNRQDEDDENNTWNGNSTQQM